MLEASQQQHQTTPSDEQQQQAAAAGPADMPADEQQQPISGADPAGGIAVEEAIRGRAVKQRDESNARTANANMACNTALGRLDLSELLRRESNARSAASAEQSAASDA